MGGIAWTGASRGPDLPCRRMTGEGVLFSYHVIKLHILISCFHRSPFGGQVLHVWYRSYCLQSLEQPGLVSVTVWIFNLYHYQERNLTTLGFTVSLDLSLSHVRPSLCIPLSFVVGVGCTA